MTILSWNCRGLSNQRAVKVFSHLVGEKAPKILFLMEKKRMVEEMRSIQAYLQYDAMLAVPCLVRRGGVSDAMERRRSGFAYSDLYPELY